MKYSVCDVLEAKWKITAHTSDAIIIDMQVPDVNKVGFDPTKTAILGLEDIQRLLRRLHNNYADYEAFNVLQKLGL